MQPASAVKPINAAPAPYVRPEPIPLRTAVVTELGAARSVNAASEAASATAHDPARDDLLIPPPTTEKILIKPQTRDVVSRVISTRSGEVISQIPGETMLKLRAYFRAEMAKSEPEGQVVEKTA
jgi:hypothetical protein